MCAVCEEGGSSLLLSSRPGQPQPPMSSQAWMSAFWASLQREASPAPALPSPRKVGARACSAWWEGCYSFLWRPSLSMQSDIFPPLHPSSHVIEFFLSMLPLPFFWHAKVPAVCRSPQKVQRNALLLFLKSSKVEGVEYAA